MHTAHFEGFDVATDYVLWKKHSECDSLSTFRSFYHFQIDSLSPEKLSCKYASFSAFDGKIASVIALAAGLQ